MPDIATQKSAIGKRWIFLTKELSALNDRMNESLTDIFQFTNAEVQGIIDVCKQEVSGLYKASEGIAMVDMLHSFATSVTSSDSKYVRPLIKFGSHNTLAIKQGRHPILAAIAPTKVVPNDTYQDDGTNFSLITGANGKQLHLLLVFVCRVAISYI
eukprot:COSAG01_NODE_3213_length_6410_cov_2.970211_5_plen_156_part_00